MLDNNEFKNTTPDETSSSNTNSPQNFLENASSKATNFLKDNRKYLPFAGGAVALLLVICLLIGVCSSGGYMTPMKDCLKAINKEETDFFKINMTLTPKYAEKFSKNFHKTALKEMGDYEDNYDDLTETLEEFYEAINDEYDSWKISFDVKSKKKIDKDDLKDYADDIEDAADDYIDSYDDALDEDYIEYAAENLDMDEDELEKLLEDCIKYYEKNFDDVKISAGYYVKGKFVVKADKDEFDTDTVSLVILKINGDWTYCGLKGNETISGFDSDEEEAELFDFIFAFINSSDYWSGYEINSMY